MAGCLTGNGTDDGDEGTESDDTDDANIDVNDTEEGSHSSDPGTDEDAGGQNDRTESADGSEPDDSNESETDEANDTNETDGENDADEDDTDETEDESDPSGKTTSFESCTRATVSGSFADGDVAFASTGFYGDDGLYGNTMVEDGVVFGDDVAAPFSGTVVFEVGDRAGVSEGGDEIVVTVSDYGSVGTVITSLTTEQADYAAGAPTTPNPHAEDCLSDLEAEAGGDGGNSDGNADGDESDDDGNDSETDDSDTGDNAEPSLEVSIVNTNSPVDAGATLEGTVAVENAGGADGTGTVDLIVGNDPTTVESRSVSLAAGDRTTFSMGYQTPPVASDQEFPIRVETADDSDQQTVRVRGVQ